MGMYNRQENGRGAWVALRAHPSHTDNVRFQVLTAASMMFRVVFWDMMEAVRTSETSVDNHFTRQYIPEDNSEQHTDNVAAATTIKLRLRLERGIREKQKYINLG
jgi:hypothetical protein